MCKMGNHRTQLLTKLFIDLCQENNADIIDEVKEKPTVETAEVLRLKLEFEREERQLAREEAREEAQKACEAA